MLNMTGLPSGPEIARHLTAKRPWVEPDQETPGGSHVWPLRSAWAAVVQAALDLGPIIVRAGDSLCSVECRAHLRRLASFAQDGLANPTAGLSIDTAGWACGMATQALLNDGRVRRGFAFFDDRGRAALKLDLAAGAAPDRFHDIVRRFALGTDAWGEAGNERDGMPSVRWSASQGPTRAAGLPSRLKEQGDADGLVEQLADQGLAQFLTGDTLLEILRHVRQSHLPISAHFVCRGLRLDWAGALNHLEASGGVALASGLDIELQWSETRAGPQAWLLREPTSSGLMQSLALLAPDGELRLQLAPLHEAGRPQPCAWRAAIHAACGGDCGSAC